MYLTQLEEKALSGEFGEPLEIAYRVLLAIGRISNAEKLIKISWAHVSGVSFLTIGDYGLEFLEKITKKRKRNPLAKFKVFTTVNPCGMDVEKWDSIGISPEYAEKQLRIISCYEKLGTARSFTCVPFQSYPSPKKGTHVAWAESSAAVYANSVLGLKTNRESAVSALAAALAGKTVYSDLHIDENRKPTKNIEVTMKPSGALDFGILGYFAGRTVPGVVGFRNLKKSREIKETKALCAAIGTTGSCGMFTFDSREKEVETLEFGRREYDEIFSELSDGEDDEAEGIVFGCPQMTVEELYELSKALVGKKFKKKCFVFCSSRVYDLASSRGYVEIIESAGAKIVRDACADFTPLISSLGSVETDSCKGAHYMKRVHGVKIALKDTHKILAEATAASFERN